MEMSDITQGVRRVRALLTLDDLQMLVAQHVATQAGLDLTDPGVLPVLVKITSNPMPGCSAAEAVIEVRT